MIGFIFYILLAAGIGFGIGFFSVKFNHLLVILTGKLVSSGHAQRRYIVIGIFSTVLVFFSYMYLAPTFDLAHGIAIAVVYAVLFTIGVLSAEARFSQACDILHMIINAMYTNTKTGNITTSDAFEISKKMLNHIQPANKEALLLLAFFFDSRFAVFFISAFITKKFVAKRFIDITPEQQDAYINSWHNTFGLTLAIKALKSIVSFAYFTSHHSWDDIGYNGGVLKRSYLN